MDAAGVRRKAPYVAGERLAGGTFGARDGFIDPGGLCNFYLSAASRLGVRFRYGAEVTGVAREAGDEWVVSTANGRASAPFVVNACGAWAGRLASLVGFDLPVVPVRRHLFLTGPLPDLPRVIPMTIDADTGVLVRREGDRVLVAWSNADEPEGFVEAMDPTFVERFGEAFERRFPSIAAAGIDFRRSWAGLYEVTPDHHAVLGDVPGRPGFLLANGFSGHGVMHAPAAGRCLAERIVRGRVESVDVSALAFERFERGARVHETMVL
jgi:sarcosine oxidase subunit beta